MAKAKNPQLAQAIALQEAGRLDEAVALYEAVSAKAPDNVTALCNRGKILLDSGRAAEAEPLFVRALVLSPRNLAVIVNLAVSRQKQGRLEEAIDGFKAANAIDPSHHGPLNNLASLYKDQGRADEALAASRAAVERAPEGDWRSWSNLLMILHYVGDQDAARLLPEHRRFGAALEATLSPARPHANDRDPQRRLKVGFVSADLGIHPIGFFVGPAMALRDRDQYECFVYALPRRPDGVTEILRKTVDHWHEPGVATDEELAQRIRADGIDILVDLAGHTAGNRMGLFARRPAPVQATWAGYVGTTGLSQMDWLIADRHHVPAGEERHYAERILRLRDGYVCYGPLGYTPEVGPLPAGRKGHVTYGCFNNLAKLRPPVVSLWARILHAVPNARLMLKTSSLRDGETCAHVKSMFSDAGIASSRLILSGSSPHKELLATYNEVDIALDPFPYSGGLTTCEALYMGVPVVTLTGRSFAGRHSTSHLHSVGLGGFAAQDQARYHAIACGLAADVKGLADLRAGLRERMRKSPLMDAVRFARSFEAGLRQMWHQRCSADVAK